jgi:hypothetical protein
VVGVPVAFGVATLLYALLIWRALSKKDFVKATIWHRTSGFSIETRGSISGETSLKVANEDRPD